MPHITEPKPKHDHQLLKFPKDFLWGAASSSFQTEGDNKFADWWKWEQKALPPDHRSGKAADFYNLYEKDFKLAQDIGMNAQRLSIEWSRIEPKQGEFDHHEIEHYQKVLKSLKDKGMTVMLTLHHFSNPQWIADLGGWENADTADYFAKFVQRIVPDLKEHVDLWVTINEPGIYVYMAYMEGLWPPQKKSRLAGLKAYWNMAAAHKKAYSVIHELIPHAKVGIAQNLQSYSAYHTHSLLEQAAVLFSDLSANHFFYYMTHGYHDFLGVNYYFHHRYNHLAKKRFGLQLVDVAKESREVSDLGWEVYPEGIFRISKATKVDTTST